MTIWEYTARRFERTISSTDMDQPKLPEETPEGRPKSHFKCRNGLYPYIWEHKRMVVTNDKVPWDVPFEGYDKVPYFSSPLTLNYVHGDPEFFSARNFTYKWNAMDGNIDRRSCLGCYDVVDNYPLNPVGRTGMRGRGALFRWGPNHVVKFVVTRWKRFKNSKYAVLDKDTKLPILQFLTRDIDGGYRWKLPAVMYRKGETPDVSVRRHMLKIINVKRSLFERDGYSELDVMALIKDVFDFFDNGTLIYRGYIDDEKNTDNAWLEEIGMHYHDKKNTNITWLPTGCGPYNKDTTWRDALNATARPMMKVNDVLILEKVVKIMKAHW